MKLGKLLAETKTGEKRQIEPEKDGRGQKYEFELAGYHFFVRDMVKKTEESDKNINIDVVLDNTSDYSDYEYAGDVVQEPAEAGQGTVFEKINTGINDTEAERLFYTVTTDDGEVFYLVIDQGQNSNNVYLLNQVKVSDLKELAIDDESNNSGRSGSLLDSLNSLEDKDDVSETGDLSNENTKSEICIKKGVR